MNSFKIILSFIFVFLLYGLKLQAKAMSVSGSVTYTDGNAGSGLLVKAFQKELSRAEELGSSSTDSRGDYRIDYDADPEITLIVHVYNQKGGQLSSSTPLIGAGENETVNIVLSRSKPKEKRKDIFEKREIPTWKKKL